MRVKYKTENFDLSIAWKSRAFRAKLRQLWMRFRWLLKRFIVHPRTDIYSNYRDIRSSSSRFYLLKFSFFFLCRCLQQSNRSPAQNDAGPASANHNIKTKHHIPNLHVSTRLCHLVLPQRRDVLLSENRRRPTLQLRVSFWRDLDLHKLRLSHVWWPENDATERLPCGKCYRSANSRRKDFVRTFSCVKEIWRNLVQTWACFLSRKSKVAIIHKNSIIS